MKTRIAALLALLAPALLAAQTYPVASATNTSRFVSAVSTHTPLVIKYVGSNTLGGTVTVAAGGDMTLSIGAVGSSAVDTTVECDASIAASGSRSGIFDLSTPHANCDTMGEIIDLINASDNWRVIAMDTLRSDTTDNTLITLSETAANGEDGLALLGDTAVTFDVAIGVLPRELRSIKPYLSGRETGSKMLQNPLRGTKAVFYFLSANTTYGSGSSGLEGYCVLQSLRTQGSTTGSETVTQLFSIAGGATTVDGTVDARQLGGLACSEGEKLFVRVNNTEANTASVANVWAQQVNVR